MTFRLTVPPVLPLAAALILCASPTGAQTLPDTASAEGLVRSVYTMVTFEPGTTPDWDAVRSAFLPEAVVVLRTSRTATSVFSVDGFVQDFVTFIERANAVTTGFRERVLRTATTEFGDIAHVLVLYDAQIPGSGRPPQQGVDSFQLIRRDGRWWIVSIANEIPTPERPVPAPLR